MPIIVGVKFKNTNKTYYFNPMHINFNDGDGVVVETIRGIEFGTIVIANQDIDETKILSPLKPVIRKATQRDIDNYKENQEKKNFALKVCEEKVKKLNLVMKLVDAEYTLDRSKVVLSFTSEGRVDFRELVKELANVLKTRIELRQVYERDDIKMRGALAPCGRPCCCSNHLADFEKVSLKMAKNQAIIINPAKLSGVCGKLMCCLKYENDYYVETNKKMPKYGALVDTPEGRGKVEAMDVLRQRVKVRVTLSDGSFDLRLYELEDIIIITKGSLADQVDESEEE